MAIASTVLGGLQTGMQVIGDIQKGKAEESTAKYNAAVAAANATMAQQSAALAGAAGAAQAEQASLKTRAQVGGIIANQAASGIDVSSGSALDVRSSARQLGELNALSLRSNAARTAYGYQTQAANDTAQQGLYKYQSSTAMPGAELSAGGSLLGGAGSAADNYSKYQLYSGSGNSLNSGTGPGLGGIY